MTTLTQKTKKPRLPLWTLGGVLQLLAALIWIPQAWMLARSIYAMMLKVDVLETVLQSIIIFIILGVTRSALSASGARVSYLKARKVLTTLREKTLAALMVNSPLDIQAPTSGRVASILGEQAEAVVPYLSRCQPVMLRVMIVPWVMAAIVATQSWFAAILLVCIAPLIPMFMVLIGYGAKKASENQILEIGQMNGFLLDRLRGMTTIRAFAGIDIIATRLRDVSQAVLKKTMGVLRIAFLSSAVMELFSALGVAFVAVYIGFHLLGSEHVQFGVTQSAKLTLEQGLFILMLAPTFFDPLKELSAIWHDRAAGEAAIDGLSKLTEQSVKLVGQDVYARKTGAEKVADPLTSQKGALSLSFKGVCFQYPNTNQKVLQNFNLQAKAGEKIALVAPSGYGKSTILALLAGLIAADQGEIQVGGVVLDAKTADALRTHMGWISQTPHVFSGTLLHNITLGRNEITPQQVEDAINASAFAPVAHTQLYRRLGEGGQIGLSGGEVLRLALARALANPHLGVLLADEPTAHLDPVTAQEVMDGLMAVANRGVTLIVATHDHRLLPYMDQVIRLDEGEEAALELKEQAPQGLRGEGQ